MSDKAWRAHVSFMLAALVLLQLVHHYVVYQRQTLSEHLANVILERCQ